MMANSHSQLGMTNHQLGQRFQWGIIYTMGWPVGMFVESCFDC